MSLIDELIEDLIRTGRDITDVELQDLRKAVADTGFDPDARTRAGVDVAGLVWQERILASNDSISNDVRHYLRHVVVQQEWPSDERTRSTVATTVELAQRIDHDLKIIGFDLIDLPEIEAMYEEARKQGDEIWWLGDWSGRELEWRNTVSRIESVSRQYQDGEMSEDQAQRYREMVVVLRESVPILRRLKWWIPLVAVDLPPSDLHAESSSVR